MSTFLDGLFGIRGVFRAGVEAITRKAIDFVGDGWTLTDNPTTGRTEISFAGGSVPPPFAPISPPSISTSQNNYAPTGLAAADAMRLSSSGAVNITGLVAAGLAVSVKRVVNIGANIITLTNQDAGSASANRFLIAGGDLAISPNESATIYYDATSLAWRVV